MDYTKRINNMVSDAIAEQSGEIGRACYTLKKAGEKIMEKAKEKQMTVRMPAEIHKAFKQLCVEKEIDMSETIVNLITYFIETETTQPQSLTYKPFRADAAAANTHKRIM